MEGEEEEGGEEKKGEEKKEEQNKSKLIINEGSKFDLKKQISDMNKKIKFLLGDITLDEIEKQKDLNNHSRLLNLEEMNRRIVKLQFTKVDNVELDLKNEKITNKIDDVERKFDELIYGLYGENGFSLDPKKRITFVITDDFDEYKKKTDDEIAKIWEGIHELKRTTEAILSYLKDKASLKDLDDIKQYLLKKVDEIILGLNKKYVGKNENSFALKNLEEQFKKIIILLATKADHENDNWLIAKKPIMGLSCASCESYIGDLKEEQNNKYIPWNKMPIREREKEIEKDKDKEKIYRLGNGYSRVLKMVGVDNKGSLVINPTSSVDANTIIPGKNENNKNREGFDLQIQGTVYHERVQSANSKNLKEKEKTVDVIKSKNLFKKLPKIRNNSVDNLDKIIDNPNPNLNKNLNVNNAYDTNPKITKIMKKTQGKYDI